MDSEKLKAKVIEFFKAQKTDDKSDDVYHSVLNNRVQRFSSANVDHLSITETGCSAIDERVIRIFCGRSVITIAYADGEILWLDNHTRYDDYLRFSTDINLLARFDNNPDELAQCIIDTHLGNQFQPILISSVSNIPTIQDRTLFENQPFVKEVADEHKLLLNNLSYDLTPPRLHEFDNNMVSLKFASWTKIYGWLRHTRVLFQHDGEIVNILNTELARFIGLPSMHL